MSKNRCGVFVFFQVAYSWTKLIEINPDKIPETISKAVTSPSSFLYFPFIHL
jgi:hypothetical protein